MSIKRSASTGRILRKNSTTIASGCPCLCGPEHLLTNYNATRRVRKTNGVEISLWDSVEVEFDPISVAEDYEYYTSAFFPPTTGTSTFSTTAKTLTIASGSIPSVVSASLYEYVVQDVYLGAYFGTVAGGSHAYHAVSVAALVQLSTSTPKVRTILYSAASWIATFTTTKTLGWQGSSSVNDFIIASQMVERFFDTVTAGSIYEFTGTCRIECTTNTPMYQPINGIVDTVTESDMFNTVSMPPSAFYPHVILTGNQSSVDSMLASGTLTVIEV